MNDINRPISNGNKPVGDPIVNLVKEEDLPENREYAKKMQEKEKVNSSKGISDPQLNGFNPGRDCTNRYLSDDFLKRYKALRLTHSDDLGSIVRVVAHKRLDDARPIMEAVKLGEAYIAYFRTKVPLKDIEKLTQCLVQRSVSSIARDASDLLFLFGDKQIIDNPRIFFTCLESLSKVANLAAEGLNAKGDGDFKEIK